MKHLVSQLLLLVTLASLAASQTVPAEVRVSQSVMAERVATKIAPVYPPEALHARIQGTVILRAHVGKTGEVESLQLVSGHPMLAPAAIDAVRQWKYKPFLLNGEPINVQTDVTVNLTLADNAPAKGVAGDAPAGIPAGEEGGVAYPHRPGVVRVSPGIMSGLVTTKVSPDYPVDAKEQRIQGTVLMKVDIDHEGNVANIQLISGHPLLAPPAIDAVKQWKYKPYLLNGRPVEVETEVRVNFTLAQ